MSDLADTSLSTLAQHYFEITRLHKFPLGTLVIFWPAAFGLGMASHAFHVSLLLYIPRVLVFGLGITISHAAFCVYNDICDRNLDGKVERSKTRPLVTGAISLQGAWILFLALFSMFVYITYSANLHSEAITAGLLGMPMHFLYPFMKRWIWCPQVQGLSNGTTFLVGWYSIAGADINRDQTQVLLAMYMGITCWTIYYDTIYAVQDKVDDARAGIKSTAILFGASLRVVLSGFAILVIFSLVVAGIMNKQGLAYFLLSCGGAAAHFYVQLSVWDIDNREQAGMIFKANGKTGFIVFVGMVLDQVLHDGW